MTFYHWDSQSLSCLVRLKFHMYSFSDERNWMKFILFRVDLVIDGADFSPFLRPRSGGLGLLLLLLVIGLSMAGKEKQLGMPTAFKLGLDDIVFLPCLFEKEGPWSTRRRTRNVVGGRRLSILNKNTRESHSHGFLTKWVPTYESHIFIPDYQINKRPALLNN